MIECIRCRIWIDEQEYIVNFGLCESCFEEGCPCNEGRPEACPLHPWPDVPLGLNELSAKS